MASFLSQLLQMKQSAIFSTFHSVTFICILVTYVYKTYYFKTTISIYYPTSFLWKWLKQGGSGSGSHEVAAKLLARATVI